MSSTSRSILSIVLFLIGQPFASGEISVKTLDTNWLFTPENKSYFFHVKAGAYLEPQIPDEECCNGEYKLTVDTDFLDTIKEEEKKEVAIFFPTLGGLKSIFINDQKVTLPEYDYSSIGPIIPLSEATINHNQITIRIRIESKLTTFSGMWKDSPKIGNIMLLQKIRDSLYTYQKVVPTILYIIFLGMWIMFLLVQKKSSIKNPIYREYTLGFLFFGIHFLFLSGQVRDFFPKIGGVLHYPSGTLAWLSAFRITGNYALLEPKKIWTFSKIVIFLFLAQVSLLFWKNTVSIHIGILVFVSVLNICTALLVKRKGDVWTNLLFFSCLLCSLGILIDSIHVLWLIFSLKFPIIFLGRITTPPFLFMAIASLVKDLLKEMAASEKSKAIEEISLQVSHDLRAPLGTLEIISNSFDEMAQERRLILRKAINRIRDISNSLLEKNKLDTSAEFYEEEASKQSNTNGPTSLDLLIDSVLSEKNLQYREYGSLKLQYLKERPNFSFFAKVAPSDFQRALSNLIDNAVEALVSGKGNVEIRISPKTNKKIEITIQDNGRGIPSHILPRLGTRGETFGKPNGSGLGLHQVKQTIELASGTFDIASKVGIGTKASIILPRSEPPTWFLRHIQIYENQSIIILDNDPLIHTLWREKFSSYLSNHFIRMHIFSSPSKFKKFYSKNFSELSPVIFLIDYEFSGSHENGLKIIELLGIEEQSILVTNHDDESNTQNQCAKTGIRLLPKRWIDQIPIKSSDDF